MGLGLMLRLIALSFIALSFLLVGTVTTRTFINAEPIKIISTIEAGNLPEDEEERVVDMEIDPETNMIYVLFHDSGTLAVIDGSNNEVVGHIQTGSGDDIEVDTKTHTIFKKEDNAYRDSVYVIDGNSNTLVKILPEKEPNGRCEGKCAVDFNNLGYSSVMTIIPGSALYLSLYGNTSMVSLEGTDYLTRVLSSEGLPPAYGSVGAANPVTNMVYFGYSPPTVMAIDGKTGESSKILLGIPPYDIAVNPKTNMIYVVGDGSMSVIDGKTNKVLPNAVTLYSYQESNYVAVNPSTNKIYVAGQTRLSIVDGATNKLEQTINLNEYNGYSFKGLVVNPNTNMLYLADWNHRIIAINADLISDFKLSMDKGTIGDLSVDPSSKSMNINVNANEGGQMSITLPRELIDSKTSDGNSNDKFTIMPIFDRPDAVNFDTNELEYTEISTTDTYRELKIQVPAEATAVEIIGTKVVPEFPIGILLMAVVLGSVMTLTKVSWKYFRTGHEAMKL